jgi:hypothetical protein
MTWGWTFYFAPSNDPMIWNGQENIKLFFLFKNQLKINFSLKISGGHPLSNSL